RPLTERYSVHRGGWSMLFMHSFRDMVCRGAAQRPGWPGLTKQQGRHLLKPGLIRGSLCVFLAAFASVFVLLGTFTSADPEPEKTPRPFPGLVGREAAAAGPPLRGFFPGPLRTPAGDPVHWQRNTREVHPVPFLGGMALPPFNVPAPPGLPSPVMHNPLISY